MRIRAAVSVLCITAVAAGLVYAAPPGQIRIQVSLVNLFATVRDKHKAIVTGLKMDDFQVFEDGQPQEITNFSADSNLPITLGILLDTSGSESFMLAAEKDAGSRFLARVMRKGDLAMVMTFDTDVDLLADFTEDRSRLDRAINRAQINAPGSGAIIAQGPLPTSGSGGTDFYDAVYLAAHDKLSERSRPESHGYPDRRRGHRKQSEIAGSHRSPHSAPIRSCISYWWPPMEAIRALPKGSPTKPADA